MLKRFLPGQEDFFSLFKKNAEITVQAATQFYNLLNDLNNQQHYVNAIAAFEETGDEIALQTFELLHKTFITPFDRHDINHLTAGLDDILDLLNRCAQRFPYYQLESVPPEIIELAKISMDSCLLIKTAVDQLHFLKKSDEIFAQCLAIDANESAAHHIVIAGEKKLFATETDFKHFFKLKEIYAQTKAVINSCCDVGNIIKGIILEYS